MGVRGHYTFSLTLDKGHFITEFRPLVSGPEDGAFHDLSGPRPVHERHTAGVGDPQPVPAGFSVSPAVRRTIDLLVTNPRITEWPKAGTNFLAASVKCCQA